MQFKCRACHVQSLVALGDVLGSRLNLRVPILYCKDCTHFSLFPEDYRTVKKFDWDGIAYYLANEAAAKRYYRAVIPDLAEPLAKRVAGQRALRLLDIGAGLGWSLVVAGEQGIEAEGIEPEEKLARHAQNNLGLRMHATPIEVFARETWDGRPFDIIIMNQVLEHIDDPAAFVQAARAVLDKQGIMFVSVPPVNILNKLLARFFLKTGSIDKVHSHFLNPFSDPEEHVSAFSKKSALALFERLGLRNTLGFWRLSLLLLRRRGFYQRARILGIMLGAKREYALCFKEP